MRNSSGGVIDVAIEYALHVGGLGAGCQDVPIELFRWARLIRKRLSNDLREYSCDVVVGRRLVPQSVGLAIVLLRHTGRTMQLFHLEKWWIASRQRSTLALRMSL